MNEKISKRKTESEIDALGVSSRAQSVFHSVS